MTFGSEKGSRLGIWGQPQDLTSFGRPRTINHKYSKPNPCCLPQFVLEGPETLFARRMFGTGRHGARKEQETPPFQSEAPICAPKHGQVTGRSTVVIVAARTGSAQRSAMRFGLGG